MRLAEAKLLQRVKRREEYLELKVRGEVAIGSLTAIAAAVGLSMQWYNHFPGLPSSDLHFGTFLARGVTAAKLLGLAWHGKWVVGL